MNACKSPLASAQSNVHKTLSAGSSWGVENLPRSADRRVGSLLLRTNNPVIYMSFYVQNSEETLRRASPPFTLLTTRSQPWRSFELCSLSAASQKEISSNLV